MYLKPRELDQALHELKLRRCLIIGGGTDLLAHGHAAGLPCGPVLDISEIGELRTIEVTPGSVKIGAGATWSEILAASLPIHLAGLVQAASLFGSPQIRNRATIGGNLVSASPVADAMPPLLCLDAQVELASADRRRTLPLERFLVGRRSTMIENEEILTAIIISVPERPSGGGFCKLGQRNGATIAAVSAAASIVWRQDGLIGEVRVAVGALSSRARRLPSLEADLKGLRRDEDLRNIVRPAHLDELTPVTDLRSTIEHRRSVAQILIGRALASAAGGFNGE